MLAGLLLLQERYIFIIFPWPFVIFHICQMRKQINVKSSVIRQKANLKIEVTRKQRTPNFPKKAKYSFFGKFGVLCFLVTSVLRFALLHYYWRNMPKSIYAQNKCTKKGSAYINPFLVFLCFQGVLNGEISQIWVNSINVILSLIF